MIALKIRFRLFDQQNLTASTISRRLCGGRYSSPCQRRCPKNRSWQNSESVSRTTGSCSRFRRSWDRKSTVSFSMSCEHFLGDLRKARLGVTYSRRRIAINGAKVSLAVNERIAHVEVLREADERVVHRAESPCGWNLLREPRRRSSRTCGKAWSR